VIADHSSARILLSEGSSLSGRQAITALGLAGYRVDVCDPDPLCLGRFSRFVRRFHRCPPMGIDPLAYLEFVVELVVREGFTVLLSQGESLPELPAGREGIRTHMGILSLMECAKENGTRTELLRECWRLSRRTGRFVGSVEDFTPVRIDWLSAFPLAWVAIWMLAMPNAARQTSRTYASSHQLSGIAVKIIRDRYRAQKSADCAPGQRTKKR